MKSPYSRNQPDQAGEKVQQVLTDLAAIAGATPSNTDKPKPTNQELLGRLFGT